jgi:hypothetical protein
MLIVYAKEADKTLYLSTVSQSGKTTRHKLSISTGLLDIFPKIGYAVLMEEQLVQYSEQLGASI